MSNKYSWLNWQPIRTSRWLNIYLTVSVPLVFVPAFMLELHHNGGHFLQAYQTLARQEGSYRLAVILVFVDWAFLVWFTFFTKSEKVTDGDKFAVAIGIFAFVCVLLLMVLRSGYLPTIL
jgi:hypothetical protein